MKIYMKIFFLFLIVLTINSCGDLLDDYESKYGKKPFKTLSIINTPFPGLWGMASDEVIFLGDASFRSTGLLPSHYNSRLIYYLLAHEIGHLWSGIGTATDFHKENVFSEGITDYIAHSHCENVFGTLGNLYPTESSDLSTYLFLFR